MIGSRSIAVFVLLAALAGCDRSSDPPPTDRGYAGTWSRGNERSRSILSIVREGDSYRFRWRRVTDDGKWKVNCDWDGNCEEFTEPGVKASDLHFRPYVDPGTGHLMIEVDQEIYGENPRDVHYVDELVLEDDGLTLWSYTVEQNGAKYTGDFRPRRSFRKVSDGVADPPPGLPSGERGP